MKYVLKDTVEAIQWFGHRGQIVIPEIRQYDPYGENKKPCPHCLYPMSEHGWIQDTDGLSEGSDRVVCPYDWIIIRKNGTKYPCKPDIFEATYELVEE